MTAGVPAIPDGPIHRSPAGFATTSEREQLLRQTLADAGVTVGAYDDVIVRWLASTPDWPTFAVLTSWVKRAAGSA